MLAKNLKCSWNPPPNNLRLSRKDVHVWRTGLDLPSRSVLELKETLTSDEKMKADRFRFGLDRNRFIAARGILRLILSCYLSVEPGTIRFCYEKNGKPRLQNVFDKQNIQFNLSHSEGVALYVFTQGHEVGVDIECMRKFSEIEQIVEQFFSVKEGVFFATLPASKKQETFFNWWTRMEAFLKAAGEGLSFFPRRFDAVLAEGMPVKPLGISEGAKKRPTWSMWDVRPAEEFAGAVVVKGRGLNVKFWQWPS
jgi:4'-phosphopantetheinyl transferase